MWYASPFIIYILLTTKSKTQKVEKERTGVDE